MHAAMQLDAHQAIGPIKVSFLGCRQCVLGQSGLKDGWVDGNVDLEQVLSSWGKALTGMSRLDFVQFSGCFMLFLFVNTSPVQCLSRNAGGCFNILFSSSSNTFGCRSKGPCRD